MFVRSVFCLLFVTPAIAIAQQQYGFISMLGRDTVSVEKIARTGTNFVSDAVERFPRVVTRHTEMRLDSAGRVLRLEMKITLPTATTPKWRERVVIAEFLGDSERISIQNGEGLSSVTLATGGVPMTPWTSQMYSLLELYLGAALHQHSDSVLVQHFYVDAQIEEYPKLIRIKPSGFVRALSNSKIEVFHHDGLSGAGEGTFDARGHMLSYSGARSTFKTEVKRLAVLPDIELISRQFVDAERKNGVLANMSNRDTTRAQIGTTKFLVDYGRPLQRSRELVGNVIPLGAVWRTGANAATQFSTTSAITLAGLELAPGTYTLWTMPTDKGVQLIVNRQFKQWGTQYDSTRDLGRAPLVVETAGKSVEQFTISVVSTGERTGKLVFEWGTFRWSSAIELK